MKWLRKLLRRKPRPCHVGYKKSDDYRVQQGVAMCLTCGTFHYTKPHISDRYLKEMFGS